MNTLLELAERVEKAEGPDRELDVLVWLATSADEQSRKSYFEGSAISDEEVAFRATYMMANFRPTASIDAAMALVPEGWHLSTLCEDWRTGKRHARLMRRATPAQIAAFDAGGAIAFDDQAAAASTAANALTAAALRSLAAQEVEPHAG